MGACSDSELVQIVDSAIADAARRSGEWLLCKPGCNQCCTGVFAISELDAQRLRAGLAKLTPQRATAVRRRALESWNRLSADFPGDRTSGVLAPDDPAFDDFGNDEVCPALDPETGLCDLYDARPLMCRTFGPPMACDDGIAVCELCFDGADEDEIAACQVDLDLDELEAPLLLSDDRTVVAYVLGR